MGTASTTKFIKNNAGALTEQAALTTSAGAGDAQALVALNASGILDSTIVNSKTTSAGAGDSGKIPALNASGILDDTIINASATSSANKVVKMDGSGRIAAGLLPVGIGADTVNMTTSEIIAAGDLVNIWNSTGAKVRKADATIAGKHAMGFVLVGGASGAQVDVYFEGSNTAMTGLTPGQQFLSTTAGTTSGTAPSGTGNVVQVVGFATSATSMNFQSGTPVTLA
jgi:hypothetical protein